MELLKCLQLQYVYILFWKIVKWEKSGIKIGRPLMGGIYRVEEEIIVYKECVKCPKKKIITDTMRAKND